MTTATEQAVEVIETATQQIEEAVETIAQNEARTWKGNIVNHSLNARGQSIAAHLEELGTEDEKGVRFNRKAYYKTAEAHGFAPKYIKELEEFNGDYALAVHAVSSDKALSRFKDNPEVDSYNVQAEIAERTEYRDNYKRYYERSVSGGAVGSGAPRVMKEDYAYHNPSIKTEYRGFNENRKAVHNLAKDLLGGK